MTQTPPNPMGLASESPGVAIVAIFRNELPYVLEWLAYHRVLGVRSFYIADNVSHDGTSELLAALDRLGLIRRLPFPSPAGKAPQLPAYAELLGLCAQQGEEWVAVIDADEFIVPSHPNQSIGATLAPLAAHPHVGAVVLNWAVYGSSWLANHSAGMVTERFVRRARPDFGANHHYKSLVRMAAFDSVGTNPHFFNLKAGWQAVHADGSALEDHPRHGRGLSARVVWSDLRVNHYIVKSREEFDTRKSRNGSAATVGRVKGDEYFVAHDRNDTREGLPVGLLTQVLAEKEHLEAALRHAGVALAPPVCEPARYAAPFQGTRVCIDRVERTGHRLTLRGWALQASGEVPSCLVVQLGADRIELSGFALHKRADVQRHFPMAQALCGFQVEVTLDEASLAAVDALAVYGGPSRDELSGPFPAPRPVCVVPEATLAR